MSLFRREIIVEPQIVGRVDGVSAPAGQVGEYVQSLLPVGSAVSLTNATAQTVTSITLTPGDWDVEANLNFNATSATTAAGSAFAAAVSTTTNTITTDGTEAYELPGAITTTSFKSSVGISRKRIMVTVATTLYLVGLANFSAGTIAGYGSITARRER
jgi:hypothetical protein